jgi:hypothetical protein
LTEVKRYFKITKHAWETRKEEFLEYLKNFYEYSINTEGRNTYFIFTKQYAEYIPFPSKRDSIPLCHRSFESNAGQSSATFKRLITDTLDTTRYCDVCKATATIKHTVSDACHTVWYRDVCQAVTI